MSKCNLNQVRELTSTDNHQVDRVHIVSNTFSQLFFDALNISS